MKHIWNTKYVSPSILYQFHFMGVSSSHIIFSFKVEDININLSFNFSGIVKGLGDSQCGGGGLLQSQ